MRYYQVKKEYDGANVLRNGRIINTLIADELITERVYNRVMNNVSICFRLPFHTIAGKEKVETFRAVYISQRKVYNCFGMRKADDSDIKIISE